ncbi:DNA-binding transcriptional regulator, AcrR family [Micromonospora phaseoli]|uniref:DNA-binding transcriptional regulator, AcrR family n=1 Tax=Micromonospora phaseoli TaxID=1144548 RepID=A0A1H6RB16_9ACTN|nr:TetR/AcrR family transcriptional regulator [Micromonospora phaseoli]PZW03284.1 TetR family transcriptional regulator [Micromonospora phaseoli]GIJ78382.1 TetR family transcriptional regulator [Micromonospora phaseoli]SEI50434.1 DNA-binding transcriptional regulator, AcrR family [Micromonospora phaseoli]
MARRRESAAGDGRPELTLTERARRAQLIEVTIELVAAKGYAGASLAAIAERAGITKAAVLYHFPTKAAVVRAAHEHALSALVGEVATAVEAAGPEDGPAAYIRSMVGHLRKHPRHTRMIIEAMTHDEGDHDPAARWRPLAELITVAGHARGASADGDARTTAIIIGGAIDAIVSEQLHDPDYDTAAAADLLVELLGRKLSP